MVRDIHILFINAGNVELGGNLLCRKAGSKCGLDEHVDRCNPHPGAIRGIPKLHTARKVVVSFVRAYIWTQRTHIDRCLLKGGAGEGTRAVGCADGSKVTPLRGECRIGGDLPLSRDFIFEGEAAISRSLALRTAPHTCSSGSESPGVMGPDELVEAWEPKGVEKGSGAIGRFRGGWRLSESLSSPELWDAGCAANVLSNASQEWRKS
jgi:hypothetical protein